MGIIHYLTKGKTIRIAVLVAALAAACRSRSEELKSLVKREDRVVVTSILRDNQKKGDFLEVSLDLQEMNEYLEWNGKHIFHQLHGLIVYEGNSFFDTISSYLQKVPLQKKEWVRAKTARLERLGLKATVRSLRSGIIVFFELVDREIAQKINTETNKIIADKDKVRKVKQKYEKILQQLLMLAREKIFSETADAAQNALINIRGAMAK